MSGRSVSQDGLMNHRSEVAKDGEPLFTFERSVQERGGGTLYHSIPREARDLLGLKKSQNIRVELYQNGYFVTQANPED